MVFYLLPDLSLSTLFWSFFRRIVFLFFFFRFFLFVSIHFLLVFPVSFFPVMYVMLLLWPLLLWSSFSSSAICTVTISIMKDFHLVTFDRSSYKVTASVRAATRHLEKPNHNFQNFHNFHNLQNFHNFHNLHSSHCISPYEIFS